MVLSRSFLFGLCLLFWSVFIFFPAAVPAWGGAVLLLPLSAAVPAWGGAVTLLPFSAAVPARGGAVLLLPFSAAAVPAWGRAPCCT